MEKRVKALYIADVVVRVTSGVFDEVSTKGMTQKQQEKFAKKRDKFTGRQRVEHYVKTFLKMPVTLIDTDGVYQFASTKEEREFLSKNLDKKDFGGNKIADCTYKVGFSNVKFSSKLMYGNRE